MATKKTVEQTNQVETQSEPQVETQSEPQVETQSEPQVETQSEPQVEEKKSNYNPHVKLSEHYFYAYVQRKNQEESVEDFVAKAMIKFAYNFPGQVKIGEITRIVETPKREGGAVKVMHDGYAYYRSTRVEDVVVNVQSEEEIESWDKVKIKRALRFADSENYYNLICEDIYMLLA